MTDIRIMDFTSLQPNPPPIQRADGKAKHKIKRGKVVERNPRDVDSITIHQTACTFGKRPDQPTRYHRAMGVACHALAFKDGVVAFPNPLAWWVYHGNGFNPRALGLEVEASVPGIPDDPSTPKREDLLSHFGDDGKITPVTDLMVETACVALYELVKRAEAWGATIRYIHAHRQSSSQRRSDPGWELWARVVLEYAVPSLGLQTQEDLVLGKGDKRGYAIPKDWDPIRGVGKY